MFTRILAALLHLREEEALFDRRGFPPAPGKQAHLESVGRAFIQGYNAALRTPYDFATLVARLEAVQRERKGFAYEGAGMALALTDHLQPWKRPRWSDFISVAAQHRYMLFVGYGWAVARLPWLRFHLSRVLRKFDSVLKWLILDGLGFHQGYFHPNQFFIQCSSPDWLSLDQLRAFDQGLGRSLWFYAGGRPGNIATYMRGFPERRWPDLWSGVGLAATYAGPATAAELQLLASHAGTYRDHLAQGAAFAAEARCRAGIENSHTELAAGVLCGMDATQAAALTTTHFRQSDGCSFQAYERWRKRIREALMPCSLPSIQSGLALTSHRD